MLRRQPKDSIGPEGFKEQQRRVLLLLFAGEDKYREVFHADPPTDEIRLVKDTREFLGFFA